MSRRKLFVNHMGKTVGASGIQLLITLITTPIMTRLFMPEDYAVFGLVNTAAAVMVGMGMLSLPSAYTAEKDEKEREAMLHAMLLLLAMVLLAALLIAVAFALVGRYVAMIEVPLVALAFLPIIALTYGIRQIALNISIQRGQFSQISKAQISEPMASRVGAVLLGVCFGGSPFFVLVSNVAGHLVAVYTLFHAIPREIYRHSRSFMQYRSELWAILKRKGDFVLFGTASAQAQQLMILAIQVGIAGLFSGHLAGQYIFATSILTLPISVIALASAPVVYHHLMETEKTHPQQLPGHFMAAMGLYLAVAALVYAPLHVFGEDLFAFVFGDVWGHAGAISATLSIAYAAMFVLTGLQCIFMVTRQLRTQWYGEIITALPAMLVGVYCFKVMDFDRAVFYLSWIWLIRTLALLLLTVRASLRTIAPGESASYE